MNFESSEKIKLQIKFGVEFEKERILSTLSKLWWFEKNGYKPRLPKGANVESSKDKILEPNQQLRGSAPELLIGLMAISGSDLPSQSLMENRFPNFLSQVASRVSQRLAIFISR